MAFTLINATSKAGANADAQTTNNINISNSTLLVIYVGYLTGVPIPVLSDSLGNTFISQGSISGTTLVLQGYMCINPLTAVNYNATISGVNSFPCIAVLAVGGITVTNEVLNDNAGNGTGSTVQPGSLLPGQNGALVVTGFCVNNASVSFGITAPFTIASSAQGDVGNVNSIAVAYEVQGTATSRNPTWNSVNTFNSAAMISDFIQATVAPTPFFTTMNTEFTR